MMAFMFSTSILSSTAVSVNTLEMSLSDEQLVNTCRIDALCAVDERLQNKGFRILIFDNLGSELRGAVGRRVNGKLCSLRDERKLLDNMIFLSRCRQVSGLVFDTFRRIVLKRHRIVV